MPLRGQMLCKRRADLPVADNDDIHTTVLLHLVYIFTIKKSTVLISYCTIDFVRLQ